MKNETEVLFFAYADENYYPFVLPYIFSVLKNTNDSVEIIVSDKKKFYDMYGKKISNIFSNCDVNANRFKDIESLSKNIIPNLLRFMIVPRTISDSKYTYYTDVDMLITKKLYKLALKNNIEKMDKNKTSYFNIVRPSGIHLSGIHFVNNKKYYPKIISFLDNVKDTTKYNNMIGENFLYHMMTEVFEDPSVTCKDNKRILPGHHVTRNVLRKYTDIKAELCKDPEWEYAFTQFSPEFLKMF